MSPVLKRYGNDPVYQLIDSVSLSHQISFFDFTNDERFNNPVYFADNHLNKTGSTVFSSLLAQKLKIVLAKNYK
jgi:hypothetical protein